MHIEVKRAEERFTEGGERISSRYAFSFGDYYDSTNVRFGPLLACNEEWLAAGARFAEHRHRDTEIVTWVVEGALTHRDSAGNEGVIRPGTVQRMSAGDGVVHTERNEGEAPVRLLQMWVQPDRRGGAPSYERGRVDPGARHAVLASGVELPHRAAVRLGRTDAALHLLRSGPTNRPFRTLPRAPYLYLHVISGQLHLQAEVQRTAWTCALSGGDAARVRDGDGWLWPFPGPQGVEALVWEAHSDLRRY